MPTRDHPFPEPGEAIEGIHFRLLAETANWAARLNVAPPLELLDFGGGPHIRLAALLGGQLAYTASSGITARVGTTAGWGLVYPVTSSVTWSGSIPTCTLATGSTTSAVFNFSATVGGISGGKYCFIMLDASGNPFVVAVEC